MARRSSYVGILRADGVDNVVPKQVIGIDQASRNILKAVGESSSPTPALLKAAADLNDAIANIDTPDHVCPLCAQPKHQVELMELIKGLKSAEVWADDGQSWTIDVASFDGDPDAVCGAMIDIIRGTYEEKS